MSEKIPNPSEKRPKYETVAEAKIRRAEERRLFEIEKIGEAWGKCREIKQNMAFQDAKALERIEELKDEVGAEWLEYTLKRYGYPSDTKEIAVQTERKIGWGSEGSVIGGVPEQSVYGEIEWVRLKDVKEYIMSGYSDVLFFNRSISSPAYVRLPNNQSAILVENPKLENPK